MDYPDRSHCSNKPSDFFSKLYRKFIVPWLSSQFVKAGAEVCSKADKRSAGSGAEHKNLIQHAESDPNFLFEGHLGTASIAQLRLLTFFGIDFDQQLSSDRASGLITDLSDSLVGDAWQAYHKWKLSLEGEDRFRQLRKLIGKPVDHHQKKRLEFFGFDPSTFNDRYEAEIKLDEIFSSCENSKSWRRGKKEFLRERRIKELVDCGKSREIAEERVRQHETLLAIPPAARNRSSTKRPNELQKAILVIHGCDEEKFKSEKEAFERIYAIFKDRGPEYSGVSQEEELWSEIENNEERLTQMLSFFNIPNSNMLKSSFAKKKRLFESLKNDPEAIEKWEAHFCKIEDEEDLLDRLPEDWIEKARDDKEFMEVPLMKKSQLKAVIQDLLCEGLKPNQIESMEMKEVYSRVKSYN